MSSKTSLKSLGSYTTIGDQRYVVLSDLRIDGSTRAIEYSPLKFSLDTVDDLTPETTDINYSASDQTYLILCANTIADPMTLRIFTAKLRGNVRKITVHVAEASGTAVCGPSIARDSEPGYYQIVQVRGTSDIKLIILKIFPNKAPYVY